MQSNEREKENKVFFIDHYLSDDKAFSSGERNPRDENFRFTFPRQIVVSLIPWQLSRSILVTWNSSLLAANKNEIPESIERCNLIRTRATWKCILTFPLKFSIVKCIPVTFVYRSAWLHRNTGLITLTASANDSCNVVFCVYRVFLV